MCVVDNYPQSAYVPWLVCMDSSNDDTASCNTQTGISDATIQTCLANDMATKIPKYLEIDAPIGGTPTVYVNGESVRTSYSAIERALCKAEPGLAGCAHALPLGAESEIQTFCMKDAEEVV